MLRDLRAFLGLSVKEFVLRCDESEDIERYRSALLE